MKSATQVYYSQFDAVFLDLPESVRMRIETKIDEVGLRLENFPHHQLTGSKRYRVRAGDYRIIYTFDMEQNVLHLLAVGHRREIYR